MRVRVVGEEAIEEHLVVHLCTHERRRHVKHPLAHDRTRYSGEPRTRTSGVYQE